MNNPQPTTRNPQILDVEDLQVVFHTEEGDVHAVDGVSFTAEAGKTLGIVGESGCGKSVSALAVMRLIPNPPGEIVRGRVFWKGEDLLKISPRRLPKIRGSEIAMIFQEPMSSLNPVFTVGKQMAEVLETHFHLKGKMVTERMMEMLELVGISDPASRITSYPHELSGGMIQRIMIAMALLGEPDLLIADEPTTALDVTIQAQILKLLSRIQKKTNMAIILITHDMAVIAETCDHVSVMYAGRIVESAPVIELFGNPRHPYTSGLLRSIPRRGASRDKPLSTIEGTVPSLIHLPRGCRFAQRCFQRKNQPEENQTRCFNENPVLHHVANNHQAACHYPLKGNQ